MSQELTGKDWTQIRHDYEHSDRPVEDICAEHGLSSGTLRNRVRRWGWTRRRPPLPREGPPPAPAPPVAPALDPSPACGAGKAGGAASFGDQADAADVAGDRPIAARLQGAIARLLPAIEAAAARLGAGPAPPRETERAARVLATLTRTLRELTDQQRQHAADEAARREKSRDLDKIRRDLALKLEAIVGAEDGADNGGAEPPQG
jgi:transposase-like protein